MCLLWPHGDSKDPSLSFQLGLGYAAVVHGRMHLSQAILVLLSLPFASFASWWGGGNNPVSVSLYCLVSMCES